MAGRMYLKPSLIYRSMAGNKLDLTTAGVLIIKSQLVHSRRHSHSHEEKEIHLGPKPVP